MTDKDPPTTNPDGMTEAEIQKLVATLSAMKIKPKADTPTDFLNWMSSMVSVSQETGAIPKTPMKTKSEPVTPTQPTFQYSSPWKPPLRISTFSGDGKDSTYDLWKYEVTCLMKEKHPREDLLMAVRRSLKGEAANVLMRLGTVDKVDEILNKFDSIYGSVLETEDILAEFYSAKQKPTEDCASWSMRLEDLINKAVRKGKVNPSDVNEMLRMMFHKGLRQELRDISGHLFQSITDFDKLRVAIRKLEMEHQPAAKSKQPTVKAAQADDRFDKIQAQLNKLSEQVMMLTQPHFRNQMQDSTPKSSYQDSRPAYQKSKKSKGRGRGQQTHPTPRNSEQQEVAQQPQQDRRIVCFKCGQEGHIAVGCRVRTDHRRGTLNYNRPNPGAEGLAHPQNGQ